MMKVFKTDGITLTLSDLPGAGGFTLEVNPPVVATPLKLVVHVVGHRDDERRGERQAHARRACRSTTARSR